MCQCATKAELGEPPPSWPSASPKSKKPGDGVAPYGVTIHLVQQHRFGTALGLWSPLSWLRLAILVALANVRSMAKIVRYMILGPSLGHLGSLVGRAPWGWIVVSLVCGIFSLSTIYMHQPKNDLGFETGYTTPDAPSILEMRNQRDFFTGGKEGNPWYAALFAEPRNKNSTMHTGTEFDEMKWFYRKIKNMTIRYDEDLERGITYYDLCGSTCDLNELLFTTEKMSFFGLSYPVTHIFMYQSNIGKHFYDVETTESGDLKSAKKVMLVYMAFYQTREVKADLGLYEEAIQRAVNKHNAGNHSVIFTIHGEKGMSSAVSEGMSQAFKYLGSGILLSMLLLLTVFLFFSRIFSQFSFCKIVLLWLVAIFVPILSFVTAFAIYNFLGFAITPLTIFTPFLALIHGYYTVIMLTHTWLSDSELRRDSPDEHLLEVFATCMPALLVTSSPAVAFVLCVVYPIQNYAAVSFLIGVIMVFDVIFVTFFFSPSILLICPARVFSPIPTTSSSAYRKTTLKTVENVRNYYCERVDDSRFVKLFAVIGMIVLLIVPVYIGCKSVEGNLDYRQLLKSDSPKRYGVHLMSDIVWPTWFSIMFFVNRPPNFSDPYEYGRFKRMLAEIDSIENKLPNSTDMVWINDFCRHTSSSPSDEALNMTRFKSFIEDGIYKSWKDGVKFYFINDTTPVITSMLHITTFNGTKSLADKARLFEKCRAITNKYPEFLTTPFDTEIGFADIILQVPLVIAVIPLVSTVAMFFASAIIIGNFAVAVVNGIVTGLLYASTIGFVSLFGVNINPFNAAYFLIIAALSPSFTTQFCYYYQQAMRINSKAQKVNRMNEMLRKCFFPCISSVICSIAVFLPALFCHVNIFESIAFTNLAFCGLGTILAFFIQIFLNMLPDVITGTHWFYSPPQ
ncbi:unnamed protein product [Caenorhabditis sp. 36 PRJEB53466]|nr:unnamed protein product [Caenorhabditis sp. 36 PRJEB53466]